MTNFQSVGTPNLPSGSFKTRKGHERDDDGAFGGNVETHTSMHEDVPAYLSRLKTITEHSLCNQPALFVCWYVADVPEKQSFVPNAVSYSGNDNK
jgi:hypothetical protein